MISTSRFATCESSWASTPSISFGSSRSQRPVVTRPPRASGAARSRTRSGPACRSTRPRLRQVGHRAEPLDHVVQRRRLLAARRPSRRTPRARACPRCSTGRTRARRRSRASGRARRSGPGTGRRRRRRRAGRAGPLVKSIRRVRPASRPYDLRFMPRMVRMRRSRCRRLTPRSTCAGRYRLRARAPPRSVIARRRSSSPPAARPRSRRRRSSLADCRRRSSARSDAPTPARSPAAVHERATRRPARRSSRAPAAPAATRSPTRTRPARSARTSTRRSPTCRRRSTAR